MAKRSRTTGPHGLLVVDKPLGPTSHDVVATARRLFGTRTVGHAGTLDPRASGVLLLLFGEGTKLSSHLTNDTKRYRATIRFGTATDTLDAAGTVVDRVALAPDWLDSARLQTALEAEHARRQQAPPAFSAIKVDGQRAHRISRGGGQVELAPRPVEVLALTLLSRGTHEVCVELTVSKGYYVRAFARDVATALGVPGHLAELRRLASGPFTEREALTWPPAEPPALMPLADAVRRALPIATLTTDGVRRARFGQPLTRADFIAEPPTTRAAWLDEAGQLIALGEPREEAQFGVVRGFLPAGAQSTG